MAINQEITFHLFSRAHMAHCVWGATGTRRGQSSFTGQNANYFILNNKSVQNKCWQRGAMVRNALYSKQKASEF